MEERATYGAASELADATNRMKQLADEVNRLKQDLAIWKLDIDIDVETKGDELEIVVSVKGREGLMIHISQQRVQYMAQDKSTLLSQVAQKIVDECLLTIVKENMAHKLSMAIDNVVKTTGKSSLA